MTSHKMLPRLYSFVLFTDFDERADWNDVECEVHHKRQASTEANYKSSSN